MSTGAGFLRLPLSTEAMPSGYWVDIFNPYSTKAGTAHPQIAGADGCWVSAAASADLRGTRY